MTNVERFELLPFLIVVGIVLFTLSGGCTTEDADSDSNEGDAKDKGEPLIGPTKGVYWGGWRIDFPCSEPQVPPEGYFPYEAAWLMVRFHDADCPVYGLYAYFWLDWFYYQGCSYTSAWSVLYPRTGSLGTVWESGALSSGLSIEYQGDSGYNIFVQPYLHVQRDSENASLFHVDFFGEEYEGHLEIMVENLWLWNGVWLSYFDATVTNASLTVQGQTYFPKGHATLERWFAMGGYHPTQNDIMDGYWLYEPFSWRDEKDTRIDTLLYYWVERKEGDPQVVLQGGVVTRGEEVWLVTGIVPDYDFSENFNTGGYLRRHAMTVQLDSGETLTYEVDAKKEYIDRRYEQWEYLTENENRRESHTYVLGALTFQGKTYLGGGAFEWKVTTYNPLSQFDSVPR